MAFPGTYNFSYYKGDTFEFKVYPKNSNGSTFSLQDYDVAFTISTQRGPAGVANNVLAYAVKSADNTHINCAILPSDSNALVPARQYVYDVEIRNRNAEDYPRVYTVLTGNITITDQVTIIGEDQEGES
jgi:hypothetical protein